MATKGVKAVDTRDVEGRETFMMLSTMDHMMGSYPKWYLAYDINKAIKVRVKLLPIYYSIFSKTLALMLILKLMYFRARIVAVGTLSHSITSHKSICKYWIIICIQFEKSD